MNIQTVANNLRATIAGKEQMLAQYRDARFKATGTEDVALFVSVEFLRDNIAELQRVLQDVEQCIPKEPEFDENDSEEVRNLIRMGR